MYKIILESNEGSEQRTRAIFETDQQEISHLIEGFYGLLISHGFIYESIENNILQRAEEINNELTFINDMDYDNAG